MAGRTACRGTEPFRPVTGSPHGSESLYGTPAEGSVQSAIPATTDRRRLTHRSEGHDQTCRNGVVVPPLAALARLGAVRGRLVGGPALPQPGPAGDAPTRPLGPLPPRQDPARRRLPRLGGPERLAGGR